MVEKIEKYKDKYGREYDTEAKALKGELTRDLSTALEKLAYNKYNIHRITNIYDITEALVSKKPELATYIIEKLK